VPADAVGVRAGVTTIVDQGSIGWINLPAFRRFIVEDAATETLAFLNISSVGSATWTMPPAFHGPDSVDVAATTAAVAANRDLVRGIKTHADIGCYARWGTTVVARAREVAHERLPRRRVVGEAVEAEGERSVRRTRLQVGELDVVHGDAGRIGHG